MFELYVKFLMDAVSDDNKDGEAAVHFESHGHVVELVPHIEEVFEKAECLSCLTEDLACQHISFLLNLEKLNEAKMLTKRLCSGKFPNAVHVWSLRLSIEMRCIQNNTISSRKADLQHIFELLRNILMKVSVSEAEKLWIMV